jgi:selenocysteine lyase/cysteine desulfurase
MIGHDTYPDVETLRREFPVTERCAYLNHADIAPLSHPVRDAMETYLARRATGQGPDECEDLSRQLREALAQLIHATPDTIAFVQNTSEGLNVVANALPLQTGDNVIFCDMEFPSNVYPWMNLKRRGIEARCIPHDGGGLTIERLDACADARTRVVAVSSVEFLTGFRSDLATLGDWCREHDAYFVVDGIQSLGVLPMDVHACHIDFLSCGGPKWLMGPAGQGFIYVRRELLDDLQPPFAGCISVSGWETWRDYDLAFLPDASRFELGCGNSVGQVGLLAAVRFLLDVGVESVERWTLHLTQLLIRDLGQRGYAIASNLTPQRRSAIVSFSVPGDVAEAYNQLTAADVLISQREDLIRVSPHCYNTEEEVLRVGETLGPARSR